MVWFMLVKRLELVDEDGNKIHPRNNIIKKLNNNTCFCVKLDKFIRIKDCDILDNCRKAKQCNNELNKELKQEMG